MLKTAVAALFLATLGLLSETVTADKACACVWEDKNRIASKISEECCSEGDYDGWWCLPTGDEKKFETCCVEHDKTLTIACEPGDY